MLDLNSAKTIKKYEGHTGAISYLKQTLCGKLISGGHDGLIKIWNSETAECLNTIEAILNHGRKEPEALIAKLKNFTNLDEDLARQLEAQEHQQSTTTDSSATTKKGLGTPTRLPPEFLRIPGYSLPSTVAADEQLARMLQDEILQRELANSREFGHLARSASRTNYPGAAAAAASSTSEGPNKMEKLAGKTINTTALHGCINKLKVKRCSQMVQQILYKK